MKRVAVILTLLIAYQMQAFASHILGGEITYKHESENKYKVFVTVYRDCGSCKLAGEGGGPVSKDCGKFDLFLRSAKTSECSPTALGKFTLTRESIDQILPVCGSVSSLCDNNQNSISKGVEAHRFYATIDFDDYKSYSSCGFELYVNMSLRASGTDNLSGSQLNFYNYAYINPFIAHSSPQFTDAPPMILQVNQPVRTVMLGADRSIGDSIVVEFASPLRDADRKIDFSTGYSKNRPLTVWCPDSDCFPIPKGKIPTGMYLGTDGSMVFTPVKNGEKAVTVIEAKKWVRRSGKMILASIVRLDIQLEVASLAGTNNIPELRGTSISADNQLDVCYGEQLCFDIQAKDQPYRHSDGSYQRQNTVTYNWETNITSASIAQNKTSNAPYNKISFCWTPTASDVGREYVLIVTASDDNCPLMATNSTRYTIKVNDYPKPKFEVSKLWCGNVALKVDLEKGGVFGTTSWEIFDDNGGLYASSVKAQDTIGLLHSGDYNLNAVVTNEFGCAVNYKTSIRVQENELSEHFGSIIGKTDWCEGDTVDLKASASQGIRLVNGYWLGSTDTIGTGASLKFVLGSAEDDHRIDVVVQGEKNGLYCHDRLEFPLNVHQGPETEYDNQFSCCMNETFVDLNSLVNRTGGTWKAVGHNILSGASMNPTMLENNGVPIQVCNEYTAVDPLSGCVSMDTFCSWVFPLPELIMENTVVCGNSGYFNLFNTTSNLKSFGSYYDLKWYIDGVRVFTVDGNPGLVKLATIPYGKHWVKVVLTNEFGCTVSDSAALERLDELVLSNITDATICQGEENDLNDIFQVQISGGIWNALWDANAIKNGQLNEEVCGDIQLNYTYDRFGCFASTDFTLDVVCKPQIDLDYSDTVCALFKEYPITATPSSGWFRGDNISGNILNIVQPEREYPFEYVVESRGCEFTYPGSIWVEPAPTYKVAPEPPMAVCEGEYINMGELSVQNGLLRWTAANTSMDVTDIITNYSYEPTENDITAGIVDFALDVIGHGECPVIHFDYQTTIHPKAKLDLGVMAYKGCDPYEFKPDVIAEHGKVNWKATQVTWDFGCEGETSNNLSPKFKYKGPGTYNVSVLTTTDKGCTFEQNWSDLVQVYATPKAAFVSVPDGYISIRDPRIEFKNLSTCPDAMKYHWDFGTDNPADVSELTSPVFTFPADTGEHLVRLYVETANGCFDEATSLIWVGPDIQIFVPNAFSPDLEGPESNNTFRVVGNNVKTYHIEIFNRWGNRVYTSDSLDEYWNGRNRNKVCPIGVYAYVIKATSMSGEEYDLKGTLNLIR